MTKEDREACIEKIPFIISHAIVRAFFETFPSSRLHFDIKFAIEVFQIIFIELQGIRISKEYIIQKLEGIFKVNNPFQFLSIKDASELSKDSQLNKNNQINGPISKSSQFEHELSKVINQKVLKSMTKEK